MKKYTFVLLIISVFCFAGTESVFSQDDGWEEVSYNTGEKPNCITSSEKFDYKMENFLKI